MLCQTLRASRVAVRAITAGVASASTRNLHGSVALWADQLVPVPHMSESISEGTLIKFTKQAGEGVKMDDVVAVIETDKVSVDVRSPVSGVIKTLHANVNDNVSVGAPLFTVDLDATAPAAAAGGAAAAPAPAAAPAAPAAPKPAPAPAAAPAQAAPAAAAAHMPGRKPSIQFRYGKREAIAAELAASGAAAAAAAAAAQAGGARAAAVGDYNASLDALYPSKAGAKDAFAVPPQFGRPPLAGAESLMIESGGAYWEIPAPPADKKGAKPKK